MAEIRSAQRAALTAAISSVAQNLASKDGENTEYDRALVDLTAAILGLHKSEVAGKILSPKSPLKFE